MSFAVPLQCILPFSCHAICHSLTMSFAILLPCHLLFTYHVICHLPAISMVFSCRVICYSLTTSLADRLPCHLPFFPISLLFSCRVICHHFRKMLILRFKLITKIAFLGCCKNAKCSVTPVVYGMRTPHLSNAWNFTTTGIIFLNYVSLYNVSCDGGGDGDSHFFIRKRIFQKQKEKNPNWTKNDFNVQNSSGRVGIKTQKLLL